MAGVQQPAAHEDALLLPILFLCVLTHDCVDPMEFQLLKEEIEGPSAGTKRATLLLCVQNSAHQTS